jgi:hypothetical protein
MAVEFRGLGYVSVAAAGTPVALNGGSRLMAASIVIQAPASNVGLVYLGGTDLDATHRALELAPGSSVEITGPDIRGIGEELDIGRIMVDAANNGDKISVGYFIRYS